MLQTWVARHGPCWQGITIRTKSVRLNVKNMATHTAMCVICWTVTCIKKIYRVYTDRYYSSPKLFCNLYDLKIGSTGTVMPNRKEMPNEVTSAKLKRGEHIVYLNSPVECVTWKDERDYIYIYISFQLSTTPQWLTLVLSIVEIKMSPRSLTAFCIKTGTWIGWTGMISCPSTTVLHEKLWSWHLFHPLNRQYSLSWSLISRNLLWNNSGLVNDLI